MIRNEEKEKTRKGTYKPEDVTLFCKECNSYITKGSYIRKKECHFTCVDPEIRHRIIVLEKPGQRFRTTANAGRLMICDSTHRNGTSCLRRSQLIFCYFRNDCSFSSSLVQKVLKSDRHCVLEMWQFH